MCDNKNSFSISFYKEAQGIFAMPKICIQNKKEFYDLDDKGCPTTMQYINSLHSKTILPVPVYILIDDFHIMYKVFNPKITDCNTVIKQFETSCNINVSNIVWQTYSPIQGPQLITISKKSTLQSMQETLYSEYKCRPIRYVSRGELLFFGITSHFRDLPTLNKVLWIYIEPDHLVYIKTDSGELQEIHNIPISVEDGLLLIQNKILYNNNNVSQTILLSFAKSVPNTIRNKYYQISNQNVIDLNKELAISAEQLFEELMQLNPTLTFHNKISDSNNMISMLPTTKKETNQKLSICYIGAKIGGSFLVGMKTIVIFLTYLYNTEYTASQLQQYDQRIKEITQDIKEISTQANQKQIITQFCSWLSDQCKITFPQNAFSIEKIQAYRNTNEFSITLEVESHNPMLSQHFHKLLSTYPGLSKNKAINMKCIRDNNFLFSFNILS